MNEKNSGIYEAMVVGLVAVIIMAVPIGAIWMVTMWAEDRFGEIGSAGVALLGVIAFVVVVTLGIGMLFARIYRAGAVDTIRSQQITQAGNTAAVRDVTRAIRGEITVSARNNYQYENDVRRLADTRAKLLTDGIQRPQAAQPPDMVDAAWYELRSQTQAIDYDE